MSICEKSDYIAHRTYVNKVLKKISTRKQMNQKRHLRWKMIKRKQQ